MGDWPFVFLFLMDMMRLLLFVRYKKDTIYYDQRGCSYFIFFFRFPYSTREERDPELDLKSLALVLPTTFGTHSQKSRARPLHPILFAPLLPHSPCTWRRLFPCEGHEALGV